MLSLIFWLFLEVEKKRKKEESYFQFPIHKMSHTKDESHVGKKGRISNHIKDVIFGK